MRIIYAQKNEGIDSMYICSIGLSNQVSQVLNQQYTPTQVSSCTNEDGNTHHLLPLPWFSSNLTHKCENRLYENAAPRTGSESHDFFSGG